MKTKSKNESERDEGNPTMIKFEKGTRLRVEGGPYSDRVWIARESSEASDGYPEMESETGPKTLMYLPLSRLRFAEAREGEPGSASNPFGATGNECHRGDEIRVIGLVVSQLDCGRFDEIRLRDVVSPDTVLDGMEVRISFSTEQVEDFLGGMDLTGDVEEFLIRVEYLGAGLLAGSFLA